MQNSLGDRRLDTEAPSISYRQVYDPDDSVPGSETPTLASATTCFACSDDITATLPSTWVIVLDGTNLLDGEPSLFEISSDGSSRGST